MNNNNNIFNITSSETNVNGPRGSSTASQGECSIRLEDLVLILGKLKVNTDEFEEVEKRKRSRQDRVDELIKEINELKQKQQQIQQEIQEKERELKELNEELEPIKRDYEEKKIVHDEQKQDYEKLNEAFNILNQLGIKYKPKQMEIETTEQPIETNQSDETNEVNENEQPIEQQNQSMNVIINHMNQNQSNQPQMKQFDQNERRKTSEMKEMKEKPKSLENNIFMRIPQYSGSTYEKEYNEKRKQQTIQQKERDPIESYFKHNINLIKRRSITPYDDNGKRLTGTATLDGNFENVWFKLPKYTEPTKAREWQLISDYIVEHRKHFGETGEMHALDRWYMTNGNRKCHWFNTIYNGYGNRYCWKSQLDKILFEALCGIIICYDAKKLIAAHKKSVEDNEINITEEERHYRNQYRDMLKLEEQKKAREARKERKKNVNEKENEIEIKQEFKFIGNDINEPIEIDDENDDNLKDVEIEENTQEQDASPKRNEESDSTVVEEE